MSVIVSDHFFHAACASIVHIVLVSLKCLSTNMRWLLQFVSLTSLAFLDHGGREHWQGMQCEVLSTGNYVATLEVKQSRQGKQCSYARIYANWDVRSVVQQPMRARIAGRVTPSSAQSVLPSLEMIELPLKRAPSIIACCQVRKYFVFWSVPLWNVSKETHLHNILFLYEAFTEACRFHWKAFSLEEMQECTVRSQLTTCAYIQTFLLHVMHMYMCVFSKILFQDWCDAVYEKRILFSDQYIQTSCDAYFIS
jgi:hypothetical protein